MGLRADIYRLRSQQLCRSYVCHHKRDSINHLLWLNDDDFGGRGVIRSVLDCFVDSGNWAKQDRIGRIKDSRIAGKDATRTIQAANS